MPEKIPLELKPGDLLAFPGGGSFVNRSSCVLWITWKGSRDILLDPGDSIILQGVSGFRQIVIQAIGGKKAF